MFVEVLKSFVSVYLHNTLYLLRKLSARMLSKYEDCRGLESYRLAYKKFKNFCLLSIKLFPDKTGNVNIT